MTAPDTREGGAVINRPRPLRGKWIDLARDGWKEGGEYATVRGAVMAIACPMVRLGHAEHDFKALMLDPVNRIGEQYRKRVKKPYTRYNDRDFHRELEKAWAKAVAKVAATPHAHDRAEALQIIGEARAAADTATWRGQAGARDQAILALVHTIAQERATASPSVSIREIWRRSSYRNANTIARALLSLRDTGWLDARRDSDPAQPTTYYVRLPATVPLSDSPSGVPAAAAPKHTAVSQRNAAERDAVALLHGQHAAKLWAVLGDEPVSLSALAARAEVGKASAHRWLPRLAAVGLATKTPDGWSSDDSGLSDAEHEAQAITEQRDERITLDREAWHSYREQRSASVEHAREAEASAKRRSAWKPTLLHRPASAAARRAETAHTSAPRRGSPPLADAA